MIDLHCLAPEVTRSNIARDADISGSSYVTGSRTIIESGVVIRNSRIHNAHIKSCANIIDSIVTSEPDEVGSHKCDAAGRTVVGGTDFPCIGPSAQINGSTLINSSIGEDTRIVNSTGSNCQLGK